MLPTLLYQQIFETLFCRAEAKIPNKTKPGRIRILFDDFENGPKIPNLELKQITGGKYGISLTFVVHSIKVLKQLYPEDHIILYGHSDTHIFSSINKDALSDEDRLFLHRELTERKLRVRDRRQIENPWILRRLSNCMSGEKTITCEMALDMAPDDCIIHIHGADMVWDKCFDLQNHPNYGQMPQR